MAINPNTVNILNIDELNNASSIGNDDLIVIGQGIYARKTTVAQLYQKFGLESLEDDVFELKQIQSNTDLGSVLRITDQPLQESEQITVRSNINTTDRRLEELASDLSASEKGIIKTKLGIINSGDNSFRIPSSDITSGANIHFFDTLKVSCLDIQSNKFVLPTPETIYNKICVSISGEEYGYTGGVMSLEDVSQSNKNSLESRLNQGICIAVAIYNADTDSLVGTGTRNPKTIYDEQVANPELKYIRIGSFFKNGNDYFFDVNPGIF